MQKFEPEWQNQVPQEHPHSRFVREYHDRCDAFDRQICSTDRRPSDRESALIDKNAKQVIAEIAGRMFAEGLGSGEQTCALLLREAIREIPCRSIQPADQRTRG